MSHHEYDKPRAEQPYEGWQQPFLQLPLPLPEYMENAPASEEEEEENPRGVIIIDLC